jgi:anti-sigma regulatory factor (Ser/Thr protein kinase)
MTAAFMHIGLLYRDRRDYLEGIIGYIKAGLSAGEPVMAAVPTDNLKLLREELREVRGGSSVVTHDMTVAGRNPGRILPGVLLAFAAAHAGRRVRIVGEPIWAGRSPVEYPACVQHEALINSAFADLDATILCPYDVSQLSPEAVWDARRTHPFLENWEGGSASSEYVDPTVVVGDFNRPLPPRPKRARVLGIAPSDLPGLRRFVGAQGAQAGLSGSRIADLMLAVNELATNSIVHAGGAGTLAIWFDSGQVVCEVADGGHLSDPLAGRMPAPVDQPGGRGLVLVQQLCDLVRVYTRPGATTIRIYIGR